MKFGSSTVRRTQSYQSPYRNTGSSAAGETEADTNREQRSTNLLAGVTDALARDAKTRAQEEAQKRVEELERLGATDSDEYERSKQIAEFGYEKKKEGLLSKTLGALEGIGNLGLGASLSQIGNILPLPEGSAPERIAKATREDVFGTMRDLFGRNYKSLDERFGGKIIDLNAHEGKGSFVFGNVLKHDIEEMTGYQVNEDTPFAARAAIGLAGFGGDLAADPLSYVSFGGGGVARKVAVGALSNLGKGAATEFAAKLAAEGAEAAFKAAGDDAFRVAIGRSVATKLSEEAIEETAVKLAKEAGEKAVTDGMRTAAREELVAQAVEETVAPWASAVARRDLAAIPKAIRTSPTILKEAPYLGGGIRFTPNPFGSGLRSASFAAKPIPGTTGLGRKITRFAFGAKPRLYRGELVEEGFGLAKRLEPVLNKIEHFRAGLSNDYKAVLVAQRGYLRGFDAMLGGPGAVRSALGLADASHQISILGTKAVRVLHGLDDDARSQAFNAIEEAVHQGLDLTVPEARAAFVAALPDSIPEKQIADVVNFVQDGVLGTLDLMFEKAGKVGIDLGDRRNYWPLVMTEEFSDDLGRLAESGLAVPSVAEIPEGIREGVAWVLTAMEGVSARRGKEGLQAVLGETRFANQRILGKQVKVRDIGAVTLIDQASLPEVTYATHREMREQMNEALKWLSEKVGYKPRALGKNARGTIESDPIRTIDRYFESMAGAITERQLQMNLRSAGVISDQSYRLDIGRTLARVTEGMISPRVQARLEAKAEKIAKVLGVIEGEIENPEHTMILKNLGGIEIPVPRRVASSPSRQVMRAQERIAARAKARERAARTLEAERAKFAKELEAAGVPTEAAESLAGAETLRDLRALAQATETALRDDLRRSSDDLYAVAARIKGDVDKERRALEGAARQSRREAVAADDAINKMRDALHQEIAKGIRASKVIVFDDPKSRATLARQLAGVARGRIEALLDPEDPFAQSLVDLLERALANDDPDLIYQTLDRAWKVGARGRPFETVPQHAAQLDSARGLILDAFDELRRAGMDVPKRTQLELMGNEGKESLFYVWRETAMAAKKQRNAKAWNTVIDIDARLVELAREAESDWQVRNLAMDRGFADILDVIRKVAGGQNVTRNLRHRNTLIEMLRESGMLGPELTLQLRRNGLGFQILPENVPVITVDDILTEIKRLPAPGVSTVGDVNRARLLSGFGKPADYRRYALGALRGWNGENAVKVGARDSFMESARDVLKREFESATDIIEQGPYTRVRSADGRTMWAIVGDEGELDAFIVPNGSIPLIGRDAKVPVEQMQGLLRAARDAGDDMDTLLRAAPETFEGAVTSAKTISGRLSEQLTTALDHLDDVPDTARLLNRIDSEMTRAAEAVAEASERGTAQKLRASERAELIDSLDELRELVRPLKNSSTTKEMADVAMDRFKVLGPKISRNLHPSEQGLVDAIGEQIARAQLIGDIKDKRNVRLLRLLDARETSRRQLMWDADAAVESLQSMQDDLATKLQGEYMTDALRTQEMLYQVNETLQKLLGFTTVDGKVVRTWDIEENERAVKEILDRGKKLWNELDLPEEPFDGIYQPTSGIPGFVPPDVVRLGGAAWNGQVGERAALAWVADATAKYAALGTPEGMGAFMRGMKKVLAGWRANATVARPTFHMRNWMGGYFNSQFADTRTNDWLASIASSPRFLHALSKEQSWEEALKAVPASHRPYFEWAWKSGVIHSTYAASEDLTRSLKPRSWHSALNPLSADNIAVRVGGNVMQESEIIMRMAVFMRHFDPKAPNLQETANMAKLWVDMVHFDYNDLTRSERVVKDSFIPFFVWFRRNLPLQMQNLIERPRYLARYQHLMQNLDSIDSTNADDLPPNQYRMGTQYATVGEMNADTPFWAAWVFDPDMPIEQLLELDEPLNPRSWFAMIANQLGPQFDVAAALAGNEDENYWINAPGGISQVLNSLDGLNGDQVGDGGLPGVDSTPVGVARVRPWASTLYNMLFPSLNELGGFTLEQDPARRQRMGQLPLTEQDGEEDTVTDELRAAAAMLARGVGLRMTTPADSYSTSVAQSFQRQDEAYEAKKRGLYPEEEETGGSKALDSVLASLRG